MKVNRKFGIKLVLIDIDDTLCLTEKKSFEIENQIAIKMGFLPMTRDVHLRNWGQQIENAIAVRIPGINVAEFMVQFISENSKKIKQGELDSLTKENIRTLQHLTRIGKQIVVVTSRTYDEVKHFLSKSHIIQKYISDIYYKGNLKYLKPDPRVFNEILDKYHASPSETIYIGDTLSDGYCAKAAKLHFIAVLEGGVRRKSDFKDIKVDFYAATFPDILQYIS